MAMDGSVTEKLAIGCLVSVKTTLSDDFQGQVITFDRPSNIVVIQEGSKGGARRNIRLLKANYIKELSCLGQAEDPLDIKKCFLDLNGLRAREELAIRQAEAESERIGVGVTGQAQNIFDALSKTLSWRGGGCKLVVVVNDGFTFAPDCLIGKDFSLEG
ncbi:unnamed protein product [Malus baccata var. baccata]